jgi:ankyrin repeat protein
MVLLVAIHNLVELCYMLKDLTIFYAIQNDDLNTVKSLIKKQKDFFINLRAEGTGRWGLLHFSVLNRNNTEILEFLIESGFDVECKTTYGETPLLKAIMQNNFDHVRILLNKGANPNIGDYWGKTCLLEAVWNKNLPMIELLVRYGADINFRGSVGGSSALAKACILKLLNIAQKLIELGADINIKDNINFTPLHKAVECGDLSTVRFLVEKGADLNALQFYNFTPLVMALYYKDLTIAKFLIESGADTTIKDLEGKTALDYTKDEEVRRLILSHSVPST